MTVLERIKERVAGSRLARTKKATYTAGENGTEKKREQCSPGGDVLYIKELGDKSSITFYENGAVQYCSNGRKTTFDIGSCTDIKYIYDGETVIVDENEFQGEEDWLWRFIVEGENRIMENDEYNARLGQRIKDSTGEYHRGEMVYFQQFEGDDAMIDKLFSYEDDELQEVSGDVFEVIRGYLTEKQYQVIRMYYKDGISLKEIAEYMGISSPAAFYLKEAAVKRLLAAGKEKILI